MNDIDPLAMCSFVDGSGYVGHPTQMTWEMVSRTQNIPAAIATSIRALWMHKKKVPVLYLGMVVEGYERHIDLDAPDAADQIANIHKGSFEEDFKNNPASTVMESLVTTVAENDAVGQFQMWTVKQRYRYTDGGIIVFEDPVFHSEADNKTTAGGYVLGLLRALLDEIGRKP